MYATIKTISGSTLGKSALSVVSTATAYILIPVAYQYAMTDFTKGLVLAIVTVWALALTRMWCEVISLTAQAMAETPVVVAVKSIATTLVEIDLLGGVPLN
jgi:hypothetical protein